MTLKIVNCISDKYLHKIYFVISLFFITLFSIFMPLFNEPDGQYHLAVTGRVAHNIIDTSRYGEKFIGTGVKSQEESYKDKTHFETYYLNKAQFIEPKNLPRNIKFNYYNFVYFGHIIPAIGLIIGKIVYPSIGVMVTFARLTSGLLYTLSVYVIIKKLRKFKLLYTALYLSPVVINSFASLSYDSLGFVIVGLFLMLLINKIEEKDSVKIENNYPKNSFMILLSSLLLIFGSKQNYWILLLLLPVYYYFDNSTFKKWIDNMRMRFSNLTKTQYLGLGLVGLVLMLISSFVISMPYGGILVIARRYFMTIIFSYGKTFGVNSWFSEPYPHINSMPSWTSALWIVLMILILFSEKTTVKHPFIGYYTFALFILGIFGVYYIQLGYNGANTSYIEGVQGRYFTPTILLLSYFFSSLNSNFKPAKKYSLQLVLLITVVVTNSMLLFNTLIDLLR